MTTSPPVDSNLVWRDGSSALNATEDITNKRIPGGTGEKGLTLNILLPTQPSDADETCDITLEALKASGGAVVETISLAQVVQGDTYPMLLSVPFKSRFEYFDLKFTLGGTTPDFGNVKAWIGSPGFESQELEDIA